MFESLLMGLMAAGALIYRSRNKATKAGNSASAEAPLMLEPPQQEVEARGQEDLGAMGQEPAEAAAGETIDENETDLVNYQDEHHLRFCDETYLVDRLLPLESAINMRDIGGYTNDRGERIKWGKIIRGEELCHLTLEDQKKLDEYGITHVFDLRQPAKAYRLPDRMPNGAVYQNLPVLEGMTSIKLDYEDPNCANKFMTYTYTTQVKERANRFVKALEVLRDDPDAVLYIHCSNGKDRTGFLTALIMLIAGIDEEKIISDYSLTNLTFDQAYAELGHTMADEVNADIKNVRDFFGVDPNWLMIQLNYIRENYGNVDDYLIDNTDLTKGDLDKIRENILERIPE